MKPIRENDASIEECGAIIRGGGVVAHRTETVYGLAADPFSRQAVEQLLQIKGRDAAKSIILLAASADEIDRVAASVSERHRALMARFWPGPLSLIFPAREDLHEALVSDSGRICVRVSSHGPASKLARAAGGLITSTSANPSGAPPAREAAAVSLPGLACVLDGGACGDGAPSTVYDPELAVMYREGAIPFAEMEEALRELK